MSTPVSERIRDIVENNDVVLFMKGVPAAPQCGFSQTAVQILAAVGAPFGAVNVLADNEIREGVKAYANWPTIPQLYIKGQFVGGCDIMRDMYQSGELVGFLESSGVALQPAGIAE